MEFYKVIDKRRTVRDFENETISADVIEKIIEAGMKAPTNDHMRDWHYIIIQDKNTVMKLLDIIPKSIYDEDMNQLIKDWNLSDGEQQDCYRNANLFCAFLAVNSNFELRNVVEREKI